MFFLFRTGYTSCVSNKNDARFLKETKLWKHPEHDHASILEETKIGRSNQIQQVLCQHTVYKLARQLLGKI